MRIFRKSRSLTKNEGDLPDHLGIHLFRGYEAWLAMFVEAMNAQGHDWFTPGRANIIGRMPREGCKQSELLTATGLTKQALQQMLDGLEQNGVIIRVVDPDDRRARLVQLTEKGRAALMDADRIKASVSEQFEARVGAADLATLEDLLKRLVADPASSSKTGD